MDEVPSTLDKAGGVDLELRVEQDLSGNVAIAVWKALPAEMTPYHESVLDEDPLIPASARGRHSTDRQRIVQGGDAVREVTESLARALGVVSADMAAALNSLPSGSPEADAWHPGSVDVTFAVQLSAGVNALFVAQGQASAQVALRFVRSASAVPPSTASAESA